MAVQQLEALQKGNMVRVLRAELKRDLRSGEETVAEILRLGPWWTDTMLVFDLLRAQPQWAEARANRTLRHCEVQPLATVGGLTARQRRALVEAVR